MLKPKQHLGRSGLIAPDKRMCVRRNPWATAHLGHLELRSTCELTRLAQRGRRATAMARTSPATQRSTIMAPRGVLQPLGYGSLGSSCDVLSLAPFVRCAVCVIIILANKYSITWSTARGFVPGAPGATELRSTIARHEVRQPSKYPRSCRRAVCRNPWATDPLGAHALFFPWRHSCDAHLV